jgi:hypothetical protein
MTETQAFVEISSRSAAELAEKYMALWNEPDADRRRLMIAELWTEDARHILQPPQEIRGIAAAPGIAMTAILEARGYEQIEARRRAFTSTGSAPRGSASGGATTSSDSATSSSSTGTRSPRTARRPQSGSSSWSSPRTGGSSATTRSSSLERRTPMVIVAGHVTVDPEQCESYLAGSVRVVEKARGAAGCLDFA